MTPKRAPIKMSLTRRFRDVLYVLIPSVVFAASVFVIFQIWSTCIMPGVPAGQPVVEVGKPERGVRRHLRRADRHRDDSIVRLKEHRKEPSGE